ncbi:hypothetical protein GCM10010495_68770 [Kitasatospora herbaricolor]|uniref:hypothetical protein n=1 Tax=Kitasatospora herbaricolor TaxID=68217 RepID=UPI001748FBDA|nr:hypothetical protein [Kitasatospora herbaricolor]MDQ0306201.1 hypothetical protein [Kitasatospora herbaricolor]GGV41502.1 hypothetical protein GCM10010495_68770 [Kitasatospora herbaricolor]
MTDEQRTGEELRAQVTGTREEPGRTSESSADKADLAGRGRKQLEIAKEQVGVVKDQVQDKVVSGAELARDKVVHAVDVVKDHTPDQVLEQGSQVAAQARETVEQFGHRAVDSTPPQVREQVAAVVDSAKVNRKPLLVAAVTAVLTAVLLRRVFGRRR